MAKRITPDSGNMLLGSGSLFFDRLVDGVFTGERHLGHADSVNLATSVEKVEKYNKMVATRQKYASIVRQTDASVKITLNEFTDKNLALALNGKVVDVEQKFFKAIDQLFTSVKKGCYLDTAKLHISDVVVKPNAAISLAVGAAAAYGAVTSTGDVAAAGTYTGLVVNDYFVQITAPCTAAGTIDGCKFIWKKGLYGAWSAEIAATGTAQDLADGVTVAISVAAAEQFVVGDTYKATATPAITAYAPTTDYIVDEKSGRILVVDAGNIQDGETLKISYTANAFTTTKVTAGTDSSVQGRLRFVSDNASGANYYMTAWKVALSAEGDVGLISDDFASFNLTADGLSDAVNHPDEPFYALTEI